MRFDIEKLGPIQNASIDLSKLTILAGANNSGKTYVTHLVFAYLRELSHAQIGRGLDIQVEDSHVAALSSDAYVKVDLSEYRKWLPVTLERFSKRFSESIHEVYGADEKAFKGSKVSFDLGGWTQELGEGNDQLSDWSAQVRMGNKVVLDITCKDGSLIFAGTSEYPNGEEHLARQWLKTGLSKALLTNSFGRIYISSSERTGAVTFQKELDFQRSKILDELSSRGKEFNVWDIIANSVSDYPMAVTENVDYIRAIPQTKKEESHLAKHHPEIIEALKEITGGDFLIEDGEVLFSPEKHNRVKVPIVAGSSSIRSLLDLTVYLRHQAAANDVLIIDEPELNLHPENQVKLARVLAMVANAGIRVFLTTHSDYIVREFSILVMLSRFNAAHLIEPYTPQMKLNPEDLSVNQTGRFLIEQEGFKRKVKRHTIQKLEVSAESGIPSPFFDDVIRRQSQLFDEVRWGE